MHVKMHTKKPYKKTQHKLCNKVISAMVQMKRTIFLSKKSKSWFLGIILYTIKCNKHTSTHCKEKVTFSFTNKSR